jgi:hypothetical protein
MSYRFSKEAAIQMAAIVRRIATHNRINAPGPVSFSFSKGAF